MMNNDNNKCLVADCSRTQGIIALVFGIALLIVTGHVALQMLLFGAGMLLIDYGLRVLKITQVTSVIDAAIAKLCSLWRRL